MSRTISDDILGTPVKRLTINSKQKGNRNEVVAAKWLEKWTGQEFARTPSSGGLRWGQDASFACGDVVCKNQGFDFIFAIETKALKSIPVKAYLGKRSKIYTIFKQALVDADRAGKLPMVIIRENGMPAGKFYCFLNSDEMRLMFDKAVERGVIKRRDEVEHWVGVLEERITRRIIIGVHSDFILQVPYTEFAKVLKNK